MGLFSFFLRSPIGIILGLISSLLLVVVLLVVVVGALATTGGPSACTTTAGPIVVDGAHAASFDQKWDGLDATVSSGRPATVLIDDSEISSRANKYIQEKGADVKDVRVCTHDRWGEATGTVKAVVGVSASFRAKGTVDLSGDHPVVHFDDIEIGNVPGFVTSALNSVVEDAIQHALNKINLKHHYTVVLQEGKVQISGTP